MTIYTREQVRAALTAVLQEPTNTEIDAVATALGLEVEDPKPEPGVYLNTQGRVIVVSPEGVQASIDPSNGRNGVLRELRTYSADELTPARVVPAEAVQMTEDDYKALWDLADNLPASVGGMPWLKAGPAARLFLRNGADAALAKYGHGAS